MGDDTTTIEDVQNEITQHNNNIDDKDVDTDGSSSNKRKKNGMMSTSVCSSKIQV